MGLSFNTFASSNQYTIDDEAVENLFESSVQIYSLDGINETQSTQFVTATLAEKNGWVAVVLDLLVGGLAIHRVYLGGTPALIPAYFFTCGGIFGIVPLVDLVVLIIGAANDDIDKYVDNDKFFMW
ncbi:MAG TPA: TM2 domain-containing protein [Cytophagaceae bacterium]